MKRPLLLLALFLMVVSVPAAFTQNFQDTTGYTTCLGTGCTWVYNATGGNSYMTTSYGNYVINSVAEQTSYYAVTSSSAFTELKLYDADMVSLYAPGYVTGGAIGRYEIKIESDSKAHIYVNGVNTMTSGVLAVNPSYIAVNSQLASSGKIDDIVYGDSAQRIVYDMPTENNFIIKKDMLNPAASGFSFYNGTIVYSTYLPSSWSKSATGTTGGVNESIYLSNVFTGTAYATHYTGYNNYSAYDPWNIQTALVTSGAPYGMYEIYMPGESGAHSIPIKYIGMGASVAWDADSYSQLQTATITHSVAEGGYWNTGSYSYKLAIMNGNTGAFIHNESITAQTGTSTYTFTTSDTQGTYYAIVIATPVGGGAEIWMNYDWASLSAYITWHGYVNGAETNAVLSGANVSIVQGSTVVNQVTIADGNYSATGFLTGATLSFNVTKSGYSQYYATLVPMVGGSKLLNFTLNSTTPTYTGFGIGGVVRTGTLTGTLITGGYGQPIGAATCFAKNTTNGEYCSNVTNMAAWYKFDESNGCVLTTKRPYDVWCTKAGYTGGNYTVVTA